MNLFYLRFLRKLRQRGCSLEFFGFNRIISIGYREIQIKIENGVISLKDVYERYTYLHELKMSDITYTELLSDKFMDDWADRIVKYLEIAEHYNTQKNILNVWYSRERETIFKS